MFDKVTVPADGKKIEIKDGKLVVPDNPILGIMWGDAIGPDITRASLRIWDAAVQKAYGGNRKIAWMRLYAGEEAMALYGDPLPPDTLKACQEFIVSIKGPLTTPVGGGFRSLNVSLRQVLDLYACVRPVKWYPGIPSPLREPHKVDIVIFRENTEDVYMGIEWPSGSEEAVKAIRLLNENLGTQISEAAGIGIKPITEFGTKRLVRKAIRYALDNGRKSVAFMHKGNIQKYTEGAFMKWGYELAQQEFGDVTITEAELGQGKKADGKLAHQGSHCRHHVPADAPAPGRVRRDRHAEPERRLPQRRGGGGSGRRGHRARREHRRLCGRVRGDARHRAQVRQPGQDEPRPAVAFRRDDARIHWLEGSGQGDCGCLRQDRRAKRSSRMTLPG